MSFWRVIGTFLALCVLFAARSAHAECTKDTECKGDRVCEAGSCVAPPPGSAPAPAQQPAAAPAPVAPAPVAPAPVAPVPAPAVPVETKPKTKRYSPGMMVAGIFLASGGPIVLLLGIVENCSAPGCESNAQGVGLTVAGLAMIGIGIPLIVMGSQRVPDESTAPRATFSPWVNQNGAGANLGFVL
jgi:hypothetical protein